MVLQGVQGVCMERRPAARWSRSMIDRVEFLPPSSCHPNLPTFPAAARVICE